MDAEDVTKDEDDDLGTLWGALDDAGIGEGGVEERGSDLNEGDVLGAREGPVCLAFGFPEAGCSFWGQTRPVGGGTKPGTEVGVQGPGGTRIDALPWFLRSFGLVWDFPTTRSSF